MKRFYYAMCDWTVSPSNPGAGFANTKKAYAFWSKKDRDEFLGDRWFDTTAKALTRAEAEKMAETVFGGKDKGVEIFRENDQEVPQYVIMRRSKWG